MSDKLNLFFIINLLNHYQSMKQFMVLQYLKNFSPLLKGETDNIDDAITLRDVLAKMNPKDKFIVVQVMYEECNDQVAVCNDTTF